MALLQLPVPRLQAAAGGPLLLDARSQNSTASFFLSSASNLCVGCDHSSFPYFLGGCRQSSPRSHFLRTQGNELTSQRFSGVRRDGGCGIPRSDCRRAEETSGQGGYRTSRSDTRKSDFDTEFSSRDRQENGYRTSRFDSQDSDYDPGFSSTGREEGYAASRSDSRRTQGSHFSSQRSSGGRQNDYTSSPSSDSRRTRGNEFNSQRSSGGGGGGREGYDASRSDSRRTQGNNFNSQRGYNNGDGYNSNNNNASTRSDPRRSQGNNFNSQRGGSSQSRNEGGRYPARDNSRGSDPRGAVSNGQGRGKSSGRNSSSKTPRAFTPTITKRQSTSQFVSDRTIYRAPWEQGPSRTSSSSSRTTLERALSDENPLIQRLQRMREEVEDDDAEDDFDDDEDEDENEEEGDGSRPRLDRGFRTFDDEARFEGSRENSAMARIVERLSKIPNTRNIYRPRGRGGAGLLDETDSMSGPKHGQPMFPAAGRGWSTPDNPVPTPAAAPSMQRFRPDTRFPWEREESRLEGQASGEKLTRVKPPSLAELTLPEDELKRLRSLGILTRHRIKVGKLGVTNGIVESMHNEWRNSEVVRVKCEGPPAQNMKRTHEALEERTGGLVVWRAGGACLVYRGKDYVPPPLRDVLDFSEQTTSTSVAESEANEAGSEAEVDSETDEMDEGYSEQAVEARVIVPRVSSVYDPELEKEMEDILSTLGPRYNDWTGMKPTPVDADLLLGPDAKFKKPYRQLPYGVKPKLSNLELTNLRRLARPIPPHFVLGVNRGLEGIAAAIVKLWEKSEIAKIAVKRGIQNTNHERMAEHLKRLTGGVLLSRDKFFIVLYRGKDFLPPSVSAVLEERQALTMALQEEEERARLLPQSREVSDTSVERSIAGTLAETLEAKANWERVQNSEEQCTIAEDARRVARRDTSRRIERKVQLTMAKKHKAELELQKVEKRLRPAGPPEDRENITEEERHMFSKLGLKMHAFLLLGRRGVFDGTVENMHLHWKHRPLVKVIYKARDKIDLEQTARMLEYESGGILVATVPTNKGQAIIVYRGKNYQRPPELRPRTLLTKRQALKRSIEMQRQQALTKHLLVLEKEIENMQADLTKLGRDDENDDASHEPTASDLNDGQEEEEEAEDDFDGASHEPTASNLDDWQEEEDDLDGASHEPSASDSENQQEETKESTTSEVESPKEDGEDIGDGPVRHSSQSQNLDVIYRADPLSRREKLVLRQQALKEKKRAAHFNVGRSNVLAGLARAIRIHFRKHALVKVGVRGRAKGTPVEEILYQLEEATGGTLVSQESSKIILYRGWPEGQPRPTEGTGHWEELAPELRSAMIAEVQADDDYLHESDWEESEDEVADEENEKEMETQAAMDDSEVDDYSDWDEFEEEDDYDEGYVLFSSDEEDGEVDEDKDEGARHKMVVNDAVEEEDKEEVKDEEEDARREMVVNDAWDEFEEEDDYDEGYVLFSSDEEDEDVRHKMVVNDAVEGGKEEVKDEEEDARHEMVVNDAV